MFIAELYKPKIAQKAHSLLFMLNISVLHFESSVLKFPKFSFNFELVPSQYLKKYNTRCCTKMNTLI